MRPSRHPRPLWPAVAALTVAAAVARADPPADAPAPLLQQLSDETQRMYAHARLGMVRVRLPTPAWLAEQNRMRQLLAKWGSQLDPAVREQFRQEQERAAQLARQRPATQPLSSGFTVAVVPSDDRVLVATGLLVDPAGHAVFPLYIDRSDTAGATLAALTGDGRPTVASFVGSDRNTNLTVLKLADVGGGRPAPLGGDDRATPAGRPADGSVALVVPPDGSAHLTVWTAASADVGLVLRPDGTFAGFGFADDFLSAATARPIVAQLVAAGTVRRPTLGVTGTAVGRADLFDPTAAGGPSAIRVLAVDAGSAADVAGVRPADVILAVAGQSVGPRTFAAVIAGRRGATLLRVRRGPATLDLTVDLRLD